MENHICENTMSLVHHSSHILVFPSFQSFVVSGYFGVLTNKSCEISFPYKKIDFMTELICQPLLIIIIVLKGFQLPLFKAPTSWPSLPALLKIFFPLLSFLFHPHTGNLPLALIQHNSNLPYSQLMDLNKYQKGNFTSLPVAIYQKCIFNCLNPFTNIWGYLNLWDYFWFIFRSWLFL